MSSNVASSYQHCPPAGCLVDRYKRYDICELVVLWPSRWKRIVQEALSIQSKRETTRTGSRGRRMRNGSQ